MTTPADNPASRPAVGRFKTLLLGAAGVNRDVLARCPTETEKYVGLGSTVVVASVLAAISGTIAMATAAGGGDQLGSWMARLAVIGVGYGAVVFAVDRFLVSAPLNPVADEPTRRWTEIASTLAGAAPRLALAVLMAFLMAEPLLLVTFRQEINTRIADTHLDRVTTATTAINSTVDAELARIDTRITELSTADPALLATVTAVQELDNEIGDATRTVAELRAQLRNEVAGLTTGSATGRPGDG
ncbi:MAG: DUF4407 domain-containing protein, partial [Actinomycetia bacterium]|nr:DUF4407 domain-containing protein [Actinomycetes bacterium]